MIFLKENNFISPYIKNKKVEIRKSSIFYFLVNTVSDMKCTDYSPGDIVNTKGYYQPGDGGAATYTIMTYEDWINELHFSVKALSFKTDRWGLGGSNYILNPVDGYGNHKLNNGLVACIKNPNGAEGYTVKVEQWGLFEGKENNTEAIIHILGNIRTGTILFGKNKRYIINFRKKNEAYENFSEYFGENYANTWGAQINRCSFNQYCSTLRTRYTTKPAIGFANNLKLDGNDCTWFIPDGESCLSGYSDFALLEMGGYINGLEITGFNFDANGLNQYKVINSDGEEENIRTCNHSISYFTGNYGGDGSNDNFKDSNFVFLNDLGISENIKNITPTFNNVNIHHNNFYANGTVVNVSDQGGDHILIINPIESRNVSIEDNYFENWGRWVFAVDLGGEGERFYNYKFNRNRCIQTEENIEPETNKVRGLGWIDFEARKCWTGLEVCDNYVFGANGWAFNGNGKISNNITVKNNEIIRPAGWSWRSIYSYAFEWYSCHTKDLIFDNNIVKGGTIRLGKSMNNIKVSNSTLGSPVMIYSGIYNNIIFDNNIASNGTSAPLVRLQYASVPTYISDETNENYVSLDERVCNFIFTNNNGSFEGTQSMPCILYSEQDRTLYKHVSFTFENNTLGYLNAHFLQCRPVSFDPSQVIEGGLFKATMARPTNKSYSAKTNNPVVGGCYWESNTIVSDNISDITRTESAFYYQNLNLKSGNALRTVTSGYLPSNSGSNVAGDIKFTSSKKIGTQFTLIYTDDNLYIADNTGTLGEETPTHTSGTEINGSVNLTWVAPLAKLEVITI